MVRKTVYKNFYSPVVFSRVYEPLKMTIKFVYFFSTLRVVAVSHSFGYGLMDAAAMVRLARVWTTVAPQQYCEVRAPDTNKYTKSQFSNEIQRFFFM